MVRIRPVLQVGIGEVLKPRPEPHGWTDAHDRVVARRAPAWFAGGASAPTVATPPATVTARIGVTSTSTPRVEEWPAKLCPPARVAFSWTDGTPRVVPTWFHWTGGQLVMPTFLAAPHVRHGAARVRALRANPAVAITIDTDTFPPEVLLVRGQATVTEVEGVPLTVLTSQGVERRTIQARR